MSFEMKKTGYFLMKVAAWFCFGFVCLVLGASLLLFVHLQSRPMNLMFLLPKIDSYLSQNYQMHLKSTSLELSAKMNRNGLFHISSQDLALLDKDGGLIMDLPRVSLSYGLNHLLTLDYLPSSVEISDALLQLTLTKDGHLILEDQDNKQLLQQKLPDVIEPVDETTKKHADLLESETELIEKKQQDETVPTVTNQAIVIRDMDHFLNTLLQFKRLRLNDSSVVIQDLKTNRKISFPNVDFSLKRHRLTKYDINVKTSLLLTGDEPMDFDLNAQLNNSAKTLDFVLDFNRLNLSRAGRIADIFKGFKLLLRGQLIGALDFSKKEDTIRKAVKKLSFGVQTIKDGSVYLPQPLDITYPVHNITARGVFGDNLDQLFIRPVEASLTTGLSADVDIVINGIGSFLDSWNFNDVSTTINARMHNIPIEQVPTVWPAYLGPDAHAWVKQNLTNGGATTALFTLYFTGSEITDLLGDIDFKGVTVNYLAPMKPVENASGKVMLYPDRVEIFADGGKIDDIELKIGNVYLTDLLDDVPNAKIELDAQGPVPQILSLINSKPLNLLSGFAISPQKTEGNAHVQTTLHFPLTDKLQPQDVQVDVNAKVTNGSFELPFDEVVLEKAQLDLTINNDMLQTKGNAVVQGIGLNLQWNEYFSQDLEKNLQSKYILSGALSDEFLKPYWTDIDGYVRGVFDVKAEVSVDFNQKIKANITADLKNSEVQFDPVAYLKEKGVKAQLTSSLLFNKGSIQSVNFDFKQDSTARINGSYQQQNQGFKLVLNEVKAPTSSFSGKISYTPDKELDCRLKGSSWNLSRIKETPVFKNSLPNPQVEQQMPKESTDVFDIFMDMEFDNLIIDENNPLTNVAVKVARTNNIWRNLLLTLKGADEAFIRLDPQTGKLIGDSPNVGDLLLRLGFSDQFSHGRALMKGHRLDNGGLTGSINLTNLNLKEPGFIMQAVTILGIWDAISGQDMRFSDGTIPFDISPNFTLFIKEGVTYGKTLGVTFSGHIAHNSLALSGSVIPAYMINSLPGKIPVIGMLFKDSQGGGLVGVKYDVNGTPFNVRLSFNPLSSIAPGFLGRFFK